MIPQMSIVALLLVAAAVLGLFIIVKKFTLPRTFFENQRKREILLKDKMKKQEIERQMARLAADSESDEQPKKEQT